MKVASLRSAAFLSGQGCPVYYGKMKKREDEKM